LKDSLNFISKITFLRALNMGKVLIGYALSKITKKPYQLGLPISVAIEPTTSCNLRCPECPSGLRSFTRETGMLSLDFFKQTISQIAPTTTYLTMYFQGEPYLNPNFFDMVQFANQQKMYVATSSNAHYLSDENAEKTIRSGLDRLIISIDGTTQETYEQYRVGGKLEKVIEGTKNIIAWKKKLNSHTPHIIFQFLVVKPNEHQIEEVISLGKSLGVDEVSLKTAQIYEYEEGSDLIPTIDKYARYRKNSEGKYVIKNKMPNHCWKMWQSCVITWDGKIVPCCYDKDAQYSQGKLASNISFSTIWFGESYKNFRAKILKSRKEIDICKNCTEGML
jgi:radical SAM protein with 4Fe4S-binding SPASM domain